MELLIQPRALKPGFLRNYCGWFEVHLIREAYHWLYASGGVT